MVTRRSFIGILRGLDGRGLSSGTTADSTAACRRSRPAKRPDVSPSSAVDVAVTVAADPVISAMRRLLATWPVPGLLGRGRPPITTGVAGSNRLEEHPDESAS